MVPIEKDEVKRLIGAREILEGGLLEERHVATVINCRRIPSRSLRLRKVAAIWTVEAPTRVPISNTVWGRHAWMR